MINISPKVKITGYALVRSADGKPLIDGDPRDLHKSIKAALTEAEFADACRDYDERKK